MNTCEILKSATVELAGAGSLKQRLIGAYMHHLSSLSEEHVPKEVREEFCALNRAMRSVRPLPGEDAVCATVRKMSDGEAKQYAAQIVNIFSTVARSQRTNASTNVVQLYAAEG